MLIPTLVFDNFFKNPNLITEYAYGLEYKKASGGEWPGGRTKPLHEINEELFLEIGTKILKLLWPSSYENIQYQARCYFQKISKEYINEGWIHRDPTVLTAIIYLSKHEKCGTSIFEQKTVNLFKNSNIKKDVYVNKKFNKEEKYLKENNSNFEETISIKSRYNRIIIFDSQQIHAAQKFREKDVEEDRLTLVMFFSKIYGLGLSWHGPECIRT